MTEKFEKKEITKKSEDLSRWYTDVIIKAELADYAPVKGSMVFRPYGYAIWENIQKILDKKIKEGGVENAYFPLFIPESFLRKEKKHIEGFSPELAVVTIGGGKELEEKLVVRPTSETIIYDMFAKWVKSWRDLPLMVNQWCNVVRWEMRPRLFLRTTEFLWQEGHTAHSTHKEAIEETFWALKMYVNLYRDFFAIDGIYGKKSEKEKFPGAEETYTYEMMMPDTKSVQGCTSHDLGQNFSKVFDISFFDKNKNKEFVWQTSWGLSTRSIGALIMEHGDDSGLIIPPKLAPIQIVIIPIFHKEEDKREIMENIKIIEDKLKEFKIKVDSREEYSVGWKFNEWELKGVPLRIEIGEREIKNKKATLVRRDNMERYNVSFNSLSVEVRRILETIQENLFNRSRNFLKEKTKTVFNYKEFKDIIDNGNGFVKAFWCGNPDCELKIKQETKATTRVLPLNSEQEEGKCIYCGKKATQKWIFAKAY